jgi:hypothetical protein
MPLVRQYDADYGPTLAAEKPGERHDVRVSRETLRGGIRTFYLCGPDRFTSRSTRKTLLWRFAIHCRPLEVTLR